MKLGIASNAIHLPQPGVVVTTTYLFRENTFGDCCGLPG